MGIPNYYQSSANCKLSFPSLEGEEACDIVVIGGGFTGISTAYHLVEAGFKVALLERGVIGSGASGSNGGQIVSGFAIDMPDIAAMCGQDDAKKLWQLAESAKALIKNLSAKHNIDCALKWGYAFAGARPKHVKGLEKMAEDWSKNYGYAEIRLLNKGDFHNLVKSPAYCGGLVDAGSGHFHPLNFLLGLARTAVQKGLKIYEHSPALKLEGESQVITAKGRIKAQSIILCGNADLGALSSQLKNVVMPVCVPMAATSPLSAEKAKDVLSQDIAVSDCHLIPNFFRFSGDRRLLFGGGASYWKPQPKLPLPSMLRIFPQLQGVKTDYLWSGKIAITINRLPHLGKLGQNIYFAHGMSGHGVAISLLSGWLISEAVKGELEDFAVFSRIPHRNFPGGKLKAPLLALAMQYYRLKDIL